MVRLNPLDALVMRSLRNEEVLVSDPARARRLFKRDAALLLLLLVALVTRAFVDEATVVGIVANVFICSLAGLAALGGIRRAQAYRNGWLCGRQMMVSSLADAFRRDMSFEEWVEAEIERDAAVAFGYEHGE